MAVIDDADYLNAEGANALLKTLEEPSSRSLLILIGTSPARQLPTIRSRCQLVRFGRLPASTVAELLRREGMLEDRERAQELAQHCEGTLAQAMELTDPDLWSFRGTLFNQLASTQIDSVDLAGTIASFVEAAGKTAPLRRARLRQVVRFATQFYRQLLRAESGKCDGDDEQLQRLTQQALATGAAHGEQTVSRIERCLEAAQQIDRNANQSTLIACWLDDLAGALP